MKEATCICALFQKHEMEDAIFGKQAVRAECFKRISAGNKMLRALLPQRLEACAEVLSSTPRHVKQETDQFFITLIVN